VGVDPGDVHAVLIDVSEDPLPDWAVADVHRTRDPHGNRTVPELHIADALTGGWLPLSPADDDPRVVQ
jgi:hypothetical protein